MTVQFSESELQQHESSHSSDKFNSKVEKGVNLNSFGMKVPTLRISSIQKLKRSEFELIWHESSHSSDKFNSKVEKGVNLNSFGTKVPTLRISSIEKLKKE